MFEKYMQHAVSAARATFTRPANTTPYTAGDVVSNSASATILMEFVNAAREESRGGYITKVRVWTNKKDWASAMRLYLYKVPATGFSYTDPNDQSGTPATITVQAALTIPVDNLPMNTIYADYAARIGYIDLPAMRDDTDTTNSTGAYVEFVCTPTPFDCAKNMSSIFGVLVDLTGSTPASGQEFSVELEFDRC